MAIMAIPSEDHLSWLSRGLTWLHARWLEKTYPFARFGRRVSIHYSCDISRSSAMNIQIGDDVILHKDVWLNVAPESTIPASKIVLGNGCKIGRRSTISAKNRITIEDDVLFAPSVLIMDHNHDFSDIDRPIHEQGVTQGGRITIGRNCWLGYGVVVLCSAGELTIGRNSVVGANSVVTRSFPPFCVIAGSPAKVLKTYDPERKQWVKPQ
jgi:acetyltransferase-like isoleucine patch superfamily enzyme